MSKLSPQEKTILVRELCKENDITAYEIGEKTNVSNVAAHNILTGVTKNPRVKTLDIILQYLERKLIRKPSDINETIAQINNYILEPKTPYQSEYSVILERIKNLERMLRTDNDAIADGIRKIYTNTNILKKDNNDISNSLSKLITTLNES